jgi:uncharacterized delta-60 repeat protein
MKVFRIRHQAQRQSRPFANTERQELMQAIQTQLVAWAVLIVTCLSVLGQGVLPGNVDISFDPGTSVANVSVLAVQSTGKVIVGGPFTSISGVAVAIARLNTNGSVDPSFNPSLSWGASYGRVNDLIVLSDDRVLVGGLFDHVDGQPFYNLVRLDSTGNLDSTFIGGGFDMAFVKVTSVVPANGGAILVNNANAITGGIQPVFLLLLPDGTPDTTFIPTNLVGSGYNLVQQADGKVLILGYSSATFYSLFRFNTNGSLDSGFHSPIFDSATISDMGLALQPDGKILLGGGFTVVDGITNGGIVRLNTNGFVDTSFVPGKGGIGVAGWNTNLPPILNDLKTVVAIVLQKDGKIVLAGQFATFDNLIVNCITRLNSDGSLDPTFNSGTGAMNGSQLGSISSVALAPDGNVLIGGTFDHVNGISRNGIARLYGGTLTAPFQFGQPWIAAKGGFGFSVSSVPGQVFNIEASTNLRDWSGLATETNVTGTFQFFDQAATNFQRRFYREVIH